MVDLDIDIEGLNPNRDKNIYYIRVSMEGLNPKGDKQKMEK